MKKTIKAPKGFHFMKNKSCKKIDETQRQLKKHKRGAGALFLKLKVIKKHS